MILSEFRDYKNEVLFLRGSETEPLILDTQDTLNQVLHHPTPIELKGLDPGSNQDYSNPESIARELKSFLLNY